MTATFTRNVAHFVRGLRGAGLPLGPADTLDAIAAMETVGIANKSDVYWALHATLIRRREQDAVFDAAFELFWRDPKSLERAMAMLLPSIATPKEERSAAASRRVAEAFAAGPPAAPRRERQSILIDRAETYSADEALRAKDFEQMTAAEQDEARRAMTRIDLFAAPERTRRTRHAPRGVRIDMRATLRAARRQGGDVIRLKFKAPRLKPPPIVVLCDISGSMSGYSRMFLQFIHALTAARARSGQRVSSFVFGTRLTNITRLIDRRDVDEALAAVGREASGWSGGTRIGAALEDFNKRWARRVLAQGAIAILMTDGLDREAPDLLATEAARLRRSCRELIWLNPLLRFAGFEAKAAGIKALLPHVTAFRPAHNLASLTSLADALRGSHIEGVPTKRAAGMTP